MNTSEYGIALLAKYPSIQNRVYVELKKYIGVNWKFEQIKFNQIIHKLHLLRAFIYELNRISSISPLGIPHCNPKIEIKLNDGKYIIPKNSTIMTHIAEEHRNDSYWIKLTNGN